MNDSEQEIMLHKQQMRRKELENAKKASAGNGVNFGNFNKYSVGNLVDDLKNNRGYLYSTIGIVMGIIVLNVAFVVFGFVLSITEMQADSLNSMIKNQDIQVSESAEELEALWYQFDNIEKSEFSIEIMVKYSSLGLDIPEYLQEYNGGVDFRHYEQVIENKDIKID